MKVVFKNIGTQATTAFDEIDRLCRKISEETRERFWLVCKNVEIVAVFPCAEYVVERVQEENRNEPLAFVNTDGKNVNGCAEAELMKRLLSGMPMDKTEVLPDGKIVNGCVEADKREEERKAMLARIEMLEKEKQEANEGREEAENKLSELLCYMTDGRFSKSTYDIEDMKRMVDECREIQCDSCDRHSECIEETMEERRENTRLRLIVEEQKKIIAAYQRMEMAR